MTAILSAVIFLLLLPYICMALLGTFLKFAACFDKPRSPGVYGYCWMPLWQKLRRSVIVGPLP